MGQALRTTGDAALDSQIRFVLAHPGMSDWVKLALQGALEADPISAMNELEVLKAILRRRADLQISRSLGSRKPCHR